MKKKTKAKTEEKQGRFAIGQAEVQKAAETLKKYKDGKVNLENKIIENEQWYRLQHWRFMNKKTETEPTSAWLFNCLANKHADAMDNYPRGNILPREQGDTAEAKMLSAIVPVILEQNDYENTYSDEWWYKLKHGASVCGIFWNSQKLNGLGDIEIKKCDILNLFWKPGITDIQNSPDLFYVTIKDNDELLKMYPELEGKLGEGSISVAKYVYEDNIDTTDTSIVVDWYYKKRNEAGKTILHYCKFVNDVVLYATENEVQPIVDEMGNVIAEPMAQRGLYDHGLYPFEIDVLYPEEGTPCGFGFVDICKSPQMYIDKLNNSMLSYAEYSSKPRVIQRMDGAINEKEFCDPNCQVIHTTGNMNGSIEFVQPPQYNSQLNNLLEFKIDELKETSGNRDASTGGTSGATAASAIAAMQEAGSKLSRDMLKASYRSYRRKINMVIELIRQFYNNERSFRIIGENGREEFIQYSNQNLKPQAQGNIYGQVIGARLPVFDIQVTAEKSSPYNRMSQNEMMLNFFKMGFFNPQLAEQALMCLKAMDFDGRDGLVESIQQNAMMQRTLQAVAQMLIQLASATRPDLLPQIQQLLAQGGLSQMMPQGGGAEISLDNGESAVTAKARERTREATQPR